MKPSTLPIRQSCPHEVSGTALASPAACAKAGVGKRNAVEVAIAAVRACLKRIPRPFCEFAANGPNVRTRHGSRSDTRRQLVWISAHGGRSVRCRKMVWTLRFPQFVMLNLFQHPSLLLRLGA